MLTKRERWRDHYKPPRGFVHRDGKRYDPAIVQFHEHYSEAASKHGGHAPLGLADSGQDNY